MVVTHNPKNPPLRNIVHEHWPLLSKSKATRTLEDANLIFGLRHNKNLSDYLVRASTKTIDNKLANVDRNTCQRPNKCRYCPIINRTGKLKSHSNNKTFNSMMKVDCQSSNLIYVITCKTCGIQYVGQTKNRLLTRFHGHFNDIDHNRDTTVARHLNRSGTNSNIKKEFGITIISFIKPTPDSAAAKFQRDKEEKQWMRRLMTIMPSGLDPNGLNQSATSHLHTVRLTNKFLISNVGKRPPWGIMGH